MDYIFRKFDWLASKDGLNCPIDVYNNTVYLGTIESKSNGFVIKVVDTPLKGKEIVKQNDNNMFKSQNIAAQVLHKLWQFIRQHDNSSSSNMNEGNIKLKNIIKEGMEEQFFWLDPDGKFHKVSIEGHAPFAREFLKNYDYNKKIYDLMYNINWIRVTLIGYMGQNTIRFNFKKSRQPSSIQKDALNKLATGNEVVEIVDDTNNKRYIPGDW